MRAKVLVEMSRTDAWSEIMGAITLRRPVVLRSIRASRVLNMVLAATGLSGSDEAPGALRLGLSQSG